MPNVSLPGAVSLTGKKFQRGEGEIPSVAKSRGSNSNALAYALTQNAQCRLRVGQHA